MSSATLGYAAVAAGLAMALLGVAVAALGLAGRHRRWDRDARRLAYAMAGAAVAAVAVMERALIIRDFSVEFVAENGSSATPALFNVATMWSALEGSILLWALVLCGYVAAVAVRFRSRGDSLLAWAMLVMFAVSAFFFALMVGPASPFVAVNPPVGYDGPGPNPLLQNHVLMAFHPPILYLGYVGFTVPFAFAIAALATGRLDEDWLTVTRRWTLAAWGFLTLGIVLGAWWSYETLGWGGYWAWDPVENASLLPWLTGTAYLHSVIVQERRGMLRVWNLSLVIATFSLTILGTFLTRSGVLASVHSFTESGIGPAILGFFAATVAVSLALIAWRGDRLRSGGRIATPVSRESAFLANNALFAAFAFVVLLGTVFPLLVEAFDGRAISVGNPYFDRMTMPIGFSLLFLMAVAPVLPWGVSPDSSERGALSDGARVDAPRRILQLLSRRLLTPMWAAAAALSAAVLSGARGWAPLLAFGLGGFAGGTALRQTLLVVRRYRWRGLLGRSGGGMIVHLGVVLMAVALAASGSYVRQAEFNLEIGQTATFAGHELLYLGSAVMAHNNRTERVAYVRVDDAKTHGPAVVVYPYASRAIGVPSVHTALREDVALSVLSFPDQTGVSASDRASRGIGVESDASADGAAAAGDSAALDAAGMAAATGGDAAPGSDSVVLRVTVQPLVAWLWIGGMVMALGTVLSLLPGRRARQRGESSDFRRSRPDGYARILHASDECARV